ncbi:MAG: nuclear transport factor 2 family protein [Actinomycetota bacterium]
MTLTTDDRLDLLDTVRRLFRSTDRRTWDALHDVFADEVRLDYTSLAGGEPATLAPADIIAGWRAALSGLDATQHLVSNEVIDGEGDEATVTAEFIATHLFENRFGEPLWTLGGRYDIGLVRTADGWRIDSLTMTAVWASGNRDIMALAQEAPS